MALTTSQIFPQAQPNAIAHLYFCRRMAKEKKENRTALLLQPTYPFRDKRILCSVHILMEGSRMSAYDRADLDEGELRSFYNALPKPAKDVLVRLSEKYLDYTAGEIQKRFKSQRSGMPYELFLTSALSRKVHEYFEAFKPFAGLVKWYHYVPNPSTGNMMTAPCSFAAFKPQLKFEVLKKAKHLMLQTIISVNGTDYPLDSFRRFHFFLESRNEYFLLTYKDYSTLEWLAQNDPFQYSLDPTAMAQKILSRLEESNDVNRNGHFAVTTVDVPPVRRVLLSEISNSFLVLTPQWMYDGFLAEGPWTETFEKTVAGETMHIKRNKEEETAFVKLLEALHPNFAKQFNGYYYLSFADAQKKQWFLKVYHQLLSMDTQLIGMDMLQHFRYSQFAPATDMKVLKEDDNKLEVSFTLAFGPEEVPLPELQKILIAGQRAVMLKDGTLGVLTEEWLHRYTTMLKHARVDKKKLYIPKWVAISEQDQHQDGTTLKNTVDGNWWQKWEQWQNTDEHIYHVPPQIQATLRGYQHKGYEWMKLLSEVNAGACLADDMGLGKTLQTICFITDRLHQNPNGKGLIVCPSSLMYTWQQEAAKFAPHLTTYVHHGLGRDLEKSKDCQLYITSYGTLRMDIEKFIEIVFDVAVIDESHNIKNPSAKITTAVGQLQAINRVALSGTPVMNNTFDLYSQLQFLLPGMFGSREFFRREYADAIDRDGDAEKIKALQKLTGPFILRRTKEQVAKDLPEKTESVLWCQMRLAQKNMYDDVRDSIKANIFLDIQNQGLGKSKLAVLQGIMKLRQICSSPMLLPQEEQTTGDSIKTDVLMDELVNLKGHKVLVFSQFASMLYLLAENLAEKGISFFHLDGQTPAKKRASMVNDFQAEDNTTNVFLISLMAGNTGLTLTAADYVFLFDPWWNNAVQQQAIDRTHRIGQTKNVFAYKMICKDSIEEKIYNLQQKKKELSENLIGDNEGFVKQLSKEDVEYLFS